MSATTDTLTLNAKLVRRVLRATWPSVKFSVRISRFSMGSSTDVRWEDGPTEAQVERIAGQAECVRRDPLTGDILEGGNRFLGLHRSMSAEAREACASFCAAFPERGTPHQVFYATDLAAAG